MTQITTGIRSGLTHPMVYNILQLLMGSKANHEMLINKYIRPFKGMRILDIGCGTCNILSHLHCKIEYCGYDISDDYIKYAQKKYGDRGVFKCEEITIDSIKDIPKFDIVLMKGVLHHLNDDEAENLISLSRLALVDNGRLITIDGCYIDNQNYIARYLISKDRGQNIRDGVGYKALVDKEWTKIDSAIYHRYWIPYTYFIMSCQK